MLLIKGVRSQLARLNAVIVGRSDIVDRANPLTRVVAGATIVSRPPIVGYVYYAAEVVRVE
ncbi:hypothetical protein [Bradyrhizobium sp. WU425]|uniref:hypothetical protein n=1 Tax=Bradyrhizobium sp. WU425 TaxID=187029 RepID=UPI004049E3DA